MKVASIALAVLSLSACYQPPPVAVSPESPPEPPESVPEPPRAVDPAQAIAPPRRTAHAPMMPMAPLLPSRCDSATWSAQFDMTFYLAAQQYMSPERRHLYCWLKGQSIAESSLIVDAVSVAGAVGVSQFLSGTFQECIQKAGLAPGFKSA